MKRKCRKLFNIYKT